MSLNKYKINTRIGHGMQVASQSKVIVCGLARNSAKTIVETIDKCCCLGASFKEFKVLIFENNSTDNTVDRILNYRKNVQVISHTYDNFVPFGPVATSKRANYMAKCRNVYLDKVKSSYDEWDYMVVVDTDLKEWDIDDIFHSLSFTEYDVVSSNGLDTFKGKSIYYDTWSLIENGCLLNKNICNPFDPNLMPIPVDSAFGGLAIYKIRPILDVSYGLWHDEFGIFGSEHTGLHMALKANGAKQVINPYMIVKR